MLQNALCKVENYASASCPFNFLPGALCETTLGFNYRQTNSLRKKGTVSSQNIYTLDSETIYSRGQFPKLNALQGFPIHNALGLVCNSLKWGEKESGPKDRNAH